MRKGCDGEEEEKKRRKEVKIAVHYPRASQPPEWRPSGTPFSVQIKSIIKRMFLLQWQLAVKSRNLEIWNILILN